MPTMHDVIVEMPDPRRLPLLPPGVRVALCWEKRSRAAVRTQRIVLRRSGARNTAAHGWSGRPTRVVQARVLREHQPAVAAVTCRLTAFVCGKEVIPTRVRSVTGRELKAFEKHLLRSGGAASSHGVRLHVLLRMMRSRRLTEAERRHPVLVSAWNACVRAERRRMLNRLRRAVRQLQSRCERSTRSCRRRRAAS